MEKPNFFLHGSVKNTRTLVRRTDPLIGHAFTFDRKSVNRFNRPGLFMEKANGHLLCGHTLGLARPEGPPCTTVPQNSPRGKPQKSRRKDHLITWEKRVGAPRQLQDVGSQASESFPKAIHTQPLEYPPAWVRPTTSHVGGEDHLQLQGEGRFFQTRG